MCANNIIIKILVLLIKGIYKYFLADLWKKNDIRFWKRQVTFHKKETSGMKDRGGGEHYVLETA